MASQRKFVGILTSSPALGSIITMIVGGVEGLHAQQFDTMSALVSHMRIVPVDLIVCDYEFESGSALDLVGALRKQSVRRQYELMVLTGRISREIKLGCRFAKADEVIVKPMSPVFLRERILSRLGIDEDMSGNPDNWHGSSTKPPRPNFPHHLENSSGWPDNVVPLFGNGISPNLTPHDGAHPS